MKTNKAVNLEEDYQKMGQHSTFIRQGEVGGWKKILTQEQENEFDVWTANNLKGTDYPPPYSTKKKLPTIVQKIIRFLSSKIQSMGIS